MTPFLLLYALLSTYSSAEEVVVPTISQDAAAFATYRSSQLLEDLLTQDDPLATFNETLLQRGIDPVSVRGKFFSLVYQNLMKWCDARCVTAEEAPAYHAIIDRICQKMGIEKPILCFSSSVANAFATQLPGLPGIVMFGLPLINMGLTDQECEAILAHEIGHLVHGHVAKKIGLLLGSSLAVYGGLKWYFKNHPFTCIINPDSPDATKQLLEFHVSAQIKAQLIATAAQIALLMGQMKFSRYCESQADKVSAMILGTPEPLLTGLDKMTSKHPLFRLVEDLENQIANPETSGFKRALCRFRLWVIGCAVTHPLPRDRKAALMSHAPAA